MPFKHLKNIFVLIPAIIVVLALLAIFSGMLWETPPAPPQPQKIVLTEIQKSAALSTFEIIGLLEAERKVDLLARVSGFLVGIKFTEGDEVKSGQVLFNIEPDQYQAAVTSAQANALSAAANFTKTELDFNRTKDLYAKRSAPKSDLDTAQAALDVAKANTMSAQAALDQARLNLGYTTVKAPFDGHVSDTPFSEGSLLGPESGVLATVVSQDPIEANFGISDKFMAAMRLGQGTLPGQSVDNVVVRLKINGDIFYPEPGKLVYVAPLIDRSTDTIKLKAIFKNSQAVLMPGQSVTISLTAKEPPQLLLAPKAAVMTTGSGSFVYQAVTAPAPGAPEGSPAYLQAQVVPIKVGQEYDNGYEVTEGLKEGDKIIGLGLMSGGAMIRPGMPVEVIEPTPEANQPAE
jgi:membrane fusion protein (multidrug efflux system)